jgi:hypothetical protein
VITPADIACLRRLRVRWHSICQASADAHNHRVEVMAGILMRETAGGESKYLVDESGTPQNPSDDTGDRGHGHGLFQIDDRSFPYFCRTDRWKDPLENALFAGQVLADKRKYIAQGIVRASAALMTGPELERAAIAAYNCGEGNVLKSWLAGEDFDAHTTGRDYSRNVLEYAAAYREILDQVATPISASPPIPPPSMDPGLYTTGHSSSGMMGAIWRVVLKLFVGKKAGIHT